MVSSIVYLIALSALAAVTVSSCPCTREFFPMCGSDGVTYGNRCMFRCAQKTHPTLTLRRIGPCGGSALDRSKRSVNDELCSCTDELNLICGSDGVTYENPCLLKCAAKSNSELKEAHRGDCPSAKEDKWPCACAKNYRPICGSDGTTYGNECTFHCAQNTKPELTLGYEGECEKPGSARARRSARACACTRERRDVCGTDGKTYSNPCMLKCAGRTKPGLKIAHYGQC